MVGETFFPDVQSCTQYFGNFSVFDVVSIHPKRNGTRSLSPEHGCLGCLKICQTT